MSVQAAAANRPKVPVVALAKELRLCEINSLTLPAMSARPHGERPSDSPELKASTGLVLAK